MKRMMTWLTLFALSGAATATAQQAQPRTDETTLASAEVEASKTKTGAFQGSKLMYTTYFYTPTEAIVHGYEEETNVRIVSLKQNKTIWKGTIGPGETKTVPTGTGVFGFLSDKKASILVGTPSSCTVVGYWVRDEEGAFVSDHFYGRIPVSGSQDDRVLIWAWEAMDVQVTDVTTDEVVKQGKIKKGGFLEIERAKLQQLGGHVLDVRASKPNMAVQVYYDEGFFVPGPDGRTAGTKFHTYVGKTTEGKNDLNLISYHQKAKVKVVDLETDKKIWAGTIKPGDIHTLTLSGRYVGVTSDVEISALVAPYEHYKAGYAEHHYGAGVEGTGIETEFLITSPDELWIFSYFDNNHVDVIDEKSGETIWSGDLGAGHVQGLHPGYGYFRVKSSAGVSVMGGDQRCGAEYSPAAGLFKVDEQLLQVAEVILKERREQAEKQGRKLTEDEAAAPLTPAENTKARRYIRDNLGKSITADEVDQRIESMQVYE